jgi:hypothetical protein
MIRFAVLGSGSRGNSAVVLAYDEDLLDADERPWASTIRA